MIQNTNTHFIGEVVIWPSQISDSNAKAAMEHMRKEHGIEAPPPWVMPLALVTIICFAAYIWNMFKALQAERSESAR